MKLDLLVITAHPDDAELGCAGTLLKLHQLGKTTGILDLTKGEAGTRGTAETRKQEAADAANILGVAVRDNLGFEDAFFRNDTSHQLALIQKIRLYQPTIVITNAIQDRHPDHGRAADLVTEACFYSGLIKISPSLPPWRPQQILYLIQDQYVIPDVVIDITPFFRQKIDAIMAFRTQFFDPSSQEPSTHISSERYFRYIEARARTFGHYLQTDFGEGFTYPQPVKLTTPFDLL